MSRCVEDQLGIYWVNGSIDSLWLLTQVYSDTIPGGRTGIACVTAVTSI